MSTLHMHIYIVVILLKSDVIRHILKEASQKIILESWHFIHYKYRFWCWNSSFVLSQSSLSSVSPPDIWYNLKFPQEVIDSCLLSALQLEAVTYACQQHETFLADGRRAGFLIGNKLVLECVWCKTKEGFLRVEGELVIWCFTLWWRTVLVLIGRTYNQLIIYWCCILFLYKYRIVHWTNLFWIDTF